MGKYLLAEFQFGKGYVSDLPVTEGAGFMRNGSVGAMVTGAGEIQAFKGITAISGDGAKQSFLSDNGFVGLGTYGQTGRGSVFKAAELLFYIGQGNLLVNGADTGKPASTTLSYVDRDGSQEFSVSSNSYQVGLPRPSIPTVVPLTTPSAGIKPTNGAIVFVIWRISTATGQPSLPSPPSSVVELGNGSALIIFPTASSNNQDFWGVGAPRLGLRDMGALYELPEDINGKVAESTLAYSRTVTGASVPNTSNIVTITDPDVPDRFTSADIGRRISFSTYDSWITSITSPTVCVCADTNTSGGVLSGTATVKHAIKGYLRAIEIGYSDDDLFGQPFVPYDAFEPPDGNFAGLLYDTFFVEDSEGTIFYSIPNYFSFPRSDRKIFTDESATVYVDSGDGVIWRVSTQTVGQLQYVGGERPIIFDVKNKNVGCKYPQNACIGYDGRLMLWGGRPIIVGVDGRSDSTFAIPVGREFFGWENQTATKPVVTGYDPVGQYECWMYGQKIQALHAPSGRWCAPVDISAWTNYDIVGSFIKDERLVLVLNNTGDNELSLFQFNVGTGSNMTLQSNSIDLPREQATVTEVKTIIKTGSTLSSYDMSLVKNFKDTIGIGVVTPDVASPETQLLTSLRPNIKGVETLSVKIVVNNAKDFATVDRVRVYGEGNMVFTPNA